LTERHGAVYHKALREWQLAGYFMKFVLLALAVIVALVVIGLVALGSFDIPAPSGQIEKTIPADRLPH
jgi:hypothetical protein